MTEKFKENIPVILFVLFFLSGTIIYSLYNSNKKYKNEEIIKEKLDSAYKKGYEDAYFYIKNIEK